MCTCRPSSASAGTQSLCVGNAAAVSALGSLDAVAEMLGLPQTPSFMPQSSGCLWLFKTTVNASSSHGRRDALCKLCGDCHFLPAVCEYPHMDRGVTNWPLIRIISLKTVQTVMV